jgi:hypothetical protein
MLFALVLLLLAPRMASACDCGARSVRPCAAYWDAKAVFKGRVTQVSESGIREGGSERDAPFFYKLVRFKLEESFRGVRGATVEVLTGRGGSDCGYDFVPGRRYIVYAREGSKGKLTTTTCSATRPLEEAQADLRFIRGLAGAPRESAIYGRIQYSGRDLKDDSYRSQPAAGLTVRVRGAGAQLEVLTDEKGTFTVEHLRPGSYSVEPVYPEHARGYVDTKPFTLRAQQCAELGYSPWWDGRIGGRVLDESGKPVPAIHVYLISAELDVTKRENLMHNMWWATREDGSFELTNVPPGRYQLVVKLFDDPREKHFNYPRTFYPGVEDRSRATTITLGGGEWLTVGDFKLTSLQSNAK